MKQKITLFVIFTFCSAVEGFSQCAMCRAVPASNMQAGGNVGSTLNTGILYLMAIPYILLMAGLAYVFRKQISEKIKTIKATKAW